MTIPRILHQTWKDYLIPDNVKNYVKSWRDKNEKFRYYFWTDKTIRKFIKDEYPWFINYFDSYPHNIMRVDAFRYFVLHKYGGIYIDIDIECYKPVDDLLTQGDLLLFLEWPGSVSNAIMGSNKNNKFWEYCFQKLIDKHVKTGDLTIAWEITGPKFLTECLNSYESNNLRKSFNYKLFPHHYFFPIPWHKPMTDQSGQAIKYPESYGAHHWQGTWWQIQPSEATIKNDTNKNNSKRAILIILPIFVLLLVFLIALFFLHLNKI